MSLLRFIHAADLHLGSPMQKLSRYPGAPVEKMRGAPQRAVENLFQLALDHQVDALSHRGRPVRRTLARYARRIVVGRTDEAFGPSWDPIVCLRGNHDACRGYEVRLTGQRMSPSFPTNLLRSSWIVVW